jgi:CubicO group peptidase (beta-lactamase class C family)
MPEFSAAADLIERAIRERVTPGAVIEVGYADAVAWRAAFGHLTYAPDAPAVAEGTIYDLASLTKVIATTSIAMRFVDHGVISLDTAPWRSLLDHSSGLPAHVPLYKQFKGRAEFLNAIRRTKLEHERGEVAVYSDLGFMLLGFMLEFAADATLDELFAPIATELGNIGFNPAAALKARIAPTENDAWRGRLLQGEVHDENAFALGGVAGHAGLFGTAESVGNFGRAVLDTFRRDTWLAKRSTLETFATRSAVPGSSRALGWDTMLTTSSCGTLMSPRAIGHTGFTGTSVWIDPEKDLYVALLTNRVHPTREGSGIQELRRAVTDAVVRAL